MPILNYISFASGLLPLIAAIINYRNLDQSLKLIAAFLLLIFLGDFTQWIYYLGFIPIKNDQPLLYLSIVISFIFYSWIYYRAFYHKNLKRLAVITGVLGILICIFSIFKNSIWDYPTWANTAQSFFMIIICLLYFNQLFSRQEFLHIEAQPLFWFNSGVLVYSSFNIFLFMLFTRLNFSSELYKIHLITNTIVNLIYTVGLLCKPKKTT